MRRETRFWGSPLDPSTNSPVILKIAICSTDYFVDVTLPVTYVPRAFHTVRQIETRNQMLFPPSFRRSFVPVTLIVVGVCFGPGHLRANQVGLTVSSGAEACTGGNVCDQQQFALTLVQPTINTLLTATQVSQFDGSSVSASSSGTVQFGSITGLVSANVVGGSNAVEP